VPQPSKFPLTRWFPRMTRNIVLSEDESESRDCVCGRVCVRVCSTDLCVCGRSPDWPEIVRRSAQLIESDVSAHVNRL
jgi:hypothetical protein